MSSIAILMDEEYRKEDDEVRNYLVQEFQKDGINVVEDVEKGKNAILVYNTNTGITQGFKNASKKLIELNVKPIILVINAQREDVDYLEIDKDISETWRDINAELYVHSAIKFYYDSDTHTAYQVKTGEEQGISELVDTIKVLSRMKFFDEN